MGTSGIEVLDTIPPGEAHAHFHKVCGSQAFATTMTEMRPFGTVEALYAAAHHVWWRLSEDDWREGFAAHPRIGDKEGLRKKFEDQASSKVAAGAGGGQAQEEEGWEAGEQSGADTASEEVLEALAQANQDYEARFGYIFLVCATGKSAEEMLAILQVSRLCRRGGRGRGQSIIRREAGVGAGLGSGHVRSQCSRVADTARVPVIRVRSPCP